MANLWVRSYGPKIKGSRPSVPDDKTLSDKKCPCYRTTQIGTEASCIVEVSDLSAFL